MEARLTEEGVWELPPLEEILVQGDQMWVQNGFSEKKRGQRREQVTEEYELYQRVVALWQQGISYHFIGKKVGKKGTVIRDWIGKHKLPNILAGIAYKKRRGRRIDIPEVPSNDLLRVIALCLATTRHNDVYKKRWTYEKNDPADPALEYARTVLTTAFGKGSFHEHVKGTVKKDYLFYQIIFQSVAFFEYYNAVTQNSTSLPWEQMPTLEAKLAFAEAYCQGSLTVENEYRRARQQAPTPTGVVIIKKTTPENVSILEQVALLLNDVGCYPYVGVLDKLTLLQITDPDDVTRLLAYDVVPAACLSAAEKIAIGKTGRRIKGQHMILQAHQATRALPQGLTPDVIEQKQEIADRYGIQMNMVGEWYRDDSTPRVVHRHAILGELRKKHRREPVPEPPRLHAIDNVVRRFLQTTPKNEPMCRYSAQRYSHEDATFYAFAFQRGQIEKEHWTRLLMLPEEVLHARLDRTTPITVTTNGTTYQLGWHALREYCRIEGFRPYASPADEWRSHLRTIRNCLPEHVTPEQTSYRHDGLTFTLAREGDMVKVTSIDEK
ncbi:MAG: hypothetical protein Q7R76_04275 [Candidatus Woesearchaeota archaeon]|nr:hypothetical protein [Candidatus Woesearchaeota archaeon]